MSKENVPKNPDSPELYINRELSWISFHTRVFEEACDLSHPLLERIKFMAICGSNFDEFFMVRIAGLKHQVTEGVRNRPPDGMTPTQQLDACLTIAHEIVKEEVSYWNNTLLPALRDSGIIIHRMNELESWQKESLRSYFRMTILPTLTPLAYDSARPFPFISNLGLNLFVIVTDASNTEYYARIKLPVEFFCRFISVPWNKHEFSRDSHFVFLEDLVGTFLDEVFLGYNIRNYYPFRLTRDSGVTYAVDDGEDLLTAVEEGVASRRTGNPVRLEIDGGTSPEILSLLQNKFRLPSDAVFLTDGPIGMVDLWGLLKVDRPDLKDAPFGFCMPKIFEKPEHIFETLRKNDVMLYHPYDSFMPVLDFIRQAAIDPDVLTIKITLYRIEQDSPVLDALFTAMENGKQVTALVELKAKFDEKNNITYAKRLEKAGVHVIYGHRTLKVHAKLCLVIRRRGESIERFVHIGSGNYNTQTVRTYADFGYFSRDAEICQDVSNLFNMLTGYSEIQTYRRLLVAPFSLKTGILDRIEREITRQKEHGDGYIGIKTNGLIERTVIQALYRASQAGVTVQANVRGLCALRPGIPGISENITVISIVGRFLEHGRIYHFKNGGNDEVLIGSSDLMSRNLNRRVEVLLPVPDQRIRQELIRILGVHLGDNQKARILCSDGTYVRRIPSEGEKPLNSQEWLIEHRGDWHEQQGCL